MNDILLGRSVEEAIRILDALQFFEENGEVCPADWHKADKGFINRPQRFCKRLGPVNYNKKNQYLSYHRK